MIKELSDFWNQNVVPRTPPDPITVEDVNRLFPLSNPEAVVQADSDVHLTCLALGEINAKIKDLEVKKKKFETEVKLCLLDGEVLEYEGEVLATWKQAKSSVRFDAKAFKEANKHLHGEYMVETAGSRRFLIKLK